MFKVLEEKVMKLWGVVVKLGVSEAWYGWFPFLRIILYCMTASGQAAELSYLMATLGSLWKSALFVGGAQRRLTTKGKA